MDQSVQEKLKSLCKDEEAFKELKKIVDDLQHKNTTLVDRLDLLERAIESDYDSILITELQLDEPGPKIVYVNRGFTDISGYERDEIIGKTPRILQGPKTDRDTLDRLKTRLKNGRPFFGQAVNYRKDGTEFINQWDIHPLKDEEGNVTHWVSYQHDITKRKRAENRVMNTHAEFDELRQQSVSTLLDVNKDGSIISTNKAFRELTGYKEDELTGRKVWDIFAQKYRNVLKTKFTASSDNKSFEGQKLEGIIKHKKGLPIQVGCQLSVIDLKNTPVVRVEISNKTLQKRIMETLDARNKNFKKIFDKPSEFSYKVVLEDDKLLLVHVSDHFEKVTGIDPADIVEKEGLQKLIHKKDLAKAEDHIRSVYKDEASTCEYRIRTAKGEYTTVIDYARPGTCTRNGLNDCVRSAVRFK